MFTDRYPGPDGQWQSRASGCLLLAVALTTLPAIAMAETVTRGAPVNVYKDLPGVKPQGEAEANYTCHTMTEVDNHRRSGRGVRDSLPYLVTRCETDSGVSYQGTGSLVSPHWFPGINPTDLNPGKP